MPRQNHLTFAVPRRPEMMTPPRSGSTPTSRRASLTVAWSAMPTCDWGLSAEVDACHYCRSVLEREEVLGEVCSLSSLW